jgi:hypothetical protein
VINVNLLAKLTEIPIRVDFAESELSPLGVVGILLCALVIFGGVLWLTRRKPATRDRPV